MAKEKKMLKLRRVRCMNAFIGDNEHGNTPLNILETDSRGHWALLKCEVCGAEQEVTANVNGDETWRLVR